MGEVTVDADGRYQAARLPHCRASFHATEGHWSMPLNHARSIISAMLDPERAAA